jgi:hypothetical protein
MRLIEMHGHIAADVAAHRHADPGRRTVVEPGPDSGIRYLEREALQTRPPMRDARRCGARERDFAQIASPPVDSITAAAAALRMQWAQGYSGCMGVASSGCQVASISVSGFPSESPLRIAVTGRQKL